MTTSSNDGPFDVIVVGAGMAGLCCAGELVLQGARVLLLPETKEVGLALRPHVVDGNVGIMQAPTNMVGWGGGWWPSLARRLNANIVVPKGFNCLGGDFAIEGTGEIWPVQQACLSAAALATMFGDLLARVGGGDPSIRDGFVPEAERIFKKALAIPYTELSKMHRVPVAQWLQDEKANDMVSFAINMLSTALVSSTPEFCLENASMLGTFGVLRSIMCGDASFGFPYPDNRKGLAIPLAEAIEAHGGTIWRGRKVAELDVASGRVGKVVLSDGTDVSAPNVALASGNPRISQLLDPVPPEAEPALTYSTTTLPHRDYHLFAVLDEPIVPAEHKNWVGLLPVGGGYMKWFSPMHAVVPWSVKEPGTQFVMTACALPGAEVAAGKHGSDDKIFAGLADLTDSMFPGYHGAVRISDQTSHKAGHLWFEPLCVGPKLPRSVESVKGLWFVGEGSAPVEGIWMEAAASAGVLGAREIAASLVKA